ncbi:MarR family winged helix-turn-helix transcriptional regulator [Dyadobacter psychrotolerans]|uniref:MarR family transcriptional regulator n=1 Tax=Dyadobacter psychrotolerans TaxID=2541721 RepID=A0A4R5D6T8_9BACT|nr:MarR family transcriptional regulator [Dyadobacter psychrotolerans]TDE09232.1 MarR family transcriptional regulator [Dyadobacter psychrotolerans]
MNQIKTPQEIERLVTMMDLIQSIRQDIKGYFQARIREINLNLTFEMFQVMVILWRKDGINQQEIADRVQKNKASLTPLLDNLSIRNLVVRNEDPSDRRNKIISLTTEGRNYEAHIQPLISDLYDAIKEDISVEQVENMTTMLRKIQSNIKN